MPVPSFLDPEAYIDTMVGVAESTCCGRMEGKTQRHVGRVL